MTHQDEDSAVDSSHPARLPLEGFPLVHTRSLDEALSLQSSINESRCRAERLDRRAPFEWRANGVAVGSVGITVGQYRAGLRGHIECMSGGYSMTIPLAGKANVTQPAQAAPLVPGRSAAIGTPCLPAGIEMGTDYRGIQVVIPVGVVESALDALTWTRRSEPVRFELGLDLAQASISSALRLLELMIDEAGSAGRTLNSPVLQAKLADAFVHALLLGCKHNHSHLLGAADAKVEPVYLRRVAEYIAANAQQPLDIGKLTAIAGVGANTLFQAFRAHRGCSPMAFLRAQRFEQARTRLLGATTSTVAEAAFASGFEHLGRFSVGYRQRFGESPKQTLQRSRSRKLR